MISFNSEIRPIIEYEDRIRHVERGDVHRIDIVEFSPKTFVIQCIRRLTRPKLPRPAKNQDSRPTSTPVVSPSPIP